MNAAQASQALEQREAASALDLIEHPGWHDVVRHVMKEAKAARGILLGGDEESPAKVSHARGSLLVLKNIVLDVYRRANKEIPANIAALFE